VWFQCPAWFTLLLQNSLGNLAWPFQAIQTQ
jgi:hypothetical protein